MLEECERWGTNNEAEDGRSNKAEGEAFRAGDGIF
jgi:hypothetical protein